MKYKGGNIVSRKSSLLAVSPQAEIISADRPLVELKITSCNNVL
jgi:hypothetical protein